MLLLLPSHVISRSTFRRSGGQAAAGGALTPTARRRRRRQGAQCRGARVPCVAWHRSQQARTPGAAAGRCQEKQSVARSGAGRWRRQWTTMTFWRRCWILRRVARPCTGRQRHDGLLPLLAGPPAAALGQDQLRDACACRPTCPQDDGESTVGAAPLAAAQPLSISASPHYPGAAACRPARYCCACSEVPWKQAHCASRPPCHAPAAPQAYRAPPVHMRRTRRPAAPPRQHPRTPAPPPPRPRPCPRRCRRSRACSS